MPAWNDVTIAGVRVDRVEVFAGAAGAPINGAIADAVARLATAPFYVHTLAGLAYDARGRVIDDADDSTRVEICVTVSRTPLTVTRRFTCP